MAAPSSQPTARRSDRGGRVSWWPLLILLVPPVPAWGEAVLTAADFRPGFVDLFRVAAGEERAFCWGYSARERPRGFAATVTLLAPLFAWGSVTDAASPPAMREVAGGRAWSWRQPEATRQEILDLIHCTGERPVGGLTGSGVLD